MRLIVRVVPSLLLAAVLGSACSQPGAQREPERATAATVDSAPHYSAVPRSADGIGKAYRGREIAAIMGWQGAAWLEREEREREERVSLLLRELELRPGMVVADIGAGTGYHSRRIAPRVGPGGRVLAVDVQPQMVAMLEALAAQEGLANIVPVRGSARGAGLDPESIDLALMVDVYHELEYPREMLDHIARALRPGGRLVFVEYRAEDARVPIKPLHKMSQAQIRREADLDSLQWERTATTLPWQHVVVFRKR
ncbi:MAG: class I SAM-dependent methyltransferase [Pseudomonadota bacterium]|nr:class I SAM-dependent methyltransferase [Pseudomonadota bacterium]